MSRKVHIHLFSLVCILIYAAFSSAGLAIAQDETVDEKRIFRDGQINLDLLSDTWLFPELGDLIYRREKGVVTGRLESLMAFATVIQPRLQLEGETETPPDTLRISRDDISFILFGAGTFPDYPPLLPVEEDAVILSSGEVLQGIVTIWDGLVHISGRNVPPDEVELIHLAHPGRSDGIYQAQGPKAVTEENAHVANEGSPSADQAELEEHIADACWVGYTAYISQTNHSSGSSYTHSAKLEFAIKEKVLTERIETLKRWKDEWLEAGGDPQDLPVTEPGGLWAYGEPVALIPEWIQYDYTFWEYRRNEIRPNPYRATGVFWEGDVPITTAAEIYYRIPVGEMFPIEHGIGPQYYPPTIYFLGSEVGWPERAQRHGDEWFSIQPPSPVAHGGIAVEVSGKHNEWSNHTPLVLDKTQTRMKGHGSWNQGISSGYINWDLQRRSTCPPPPEVREEEWDPCEHARLRLEAINDFLDRMEPHLDELQNELSGSEERLEVLLNRMEFYREDFIRAMLLAGLGEASWMLLERLGPKVLKARAPSRTQAKRVDEMMKLLKFLQDPVKWTAGEAFPNVKEAYDMYQLYKLISERVQMEYEPALEYIDQHVTAWAPDNPISNNARTFVETARAIAPLLRKISLLTEDATRLHGSVKEATLEQEYWEESLRECEEQQKEQATG